MMDSAGPVGSRLYAIVEREQLLNVWFFMPAALIFNLGAVIAVRLWPIFFIKQGGHIIIALLQLSGAFGYLAYVMRFFTRIAPLIAKTRQEWRDDILLTEEQIQHSPK
jgi:hypothetical protein